MTTLQYAMQVPSDGYVVFPPEFRGHQVVVSMDKRANVNADQSFDDDWPNPTNEQLEKMYTMCRGVLEGMTREDFDRLREERIMGVKR